MKRISDHRSFIDTDEEHIDQLLKKWQCNSADKTENDHEERLHNYLQSHLADVPMVTQYGLAKARADIVIEDTHLIELKLGLTDTGEFQRCMGQLEVYKQKWVSKDRGPIYLVIVGDSLSEFRDLLHNWFKEANDACLIESPFYLYEKRI